MALIFETDNFTIGSHDQPLHDRNEGGHIRIFPKVAVEDRTHLSAPLAIELMKLTMVAGEAMTVGMNKQGVDVGRINYMELGNWTPTLHVHLFGRARSSRIQKFNEAMYLPLRNTGFYDTFEPLTSADRDVIKQEIIRLLATPKYQHFGV